MGGFELLFQHVQALGSPMTWASFSGAAGGQSSPRAWGQSPSHTTPGLGVVFGLLLLSWAALISPRTVCKHCLPRGDSGAGPPAPRLWGRPWCEWGKGALLLPDPRPPSFLGVLEAAFPPGRPGASRICILNVPAACSAGTAPQTLHAHVAAHRQSFGAGCFRNASLTACPRHSQDPAGLPAPGGRPPEMVCRRSQEG